MSKRNFFTPENLKHLMEDRLIRFLNLPPWIFLPGWSLCIWFPNLPSGDCRQGVQPDFTCSEPITRGQFAQGASCFIVSKLSSMRLSVRGYRLFIRLRTYFLGGLPWGWGQGHIRCCQVPFTLCDLCTCKV